MQGPAGLTRDTFNLVIYNDATASTEGYWSIELTGELRRLPKGVLSFPVSLSNEAKIYIWRELGGSNLVDVRGHTF